MAYNLGHRTIVTSRENRELREEKRQLEKEVASSSKQRVGELEKQVAALKAQLSEVESENKKLDADLIAAVRRESKHQQLVEQLQEDALKARRKGEEHGKVVAYAEKDEEFRRSMPQVRLQAVRDFIYSPVFSSANIMLGSDDLIAGWNRAISQIRSLGVEFDADQLDICLDENLEPTEDDGEEELDLNFRDHEFEPAMDDVLVLRKRFEERQAAAEERKKKKKAAQLLAAPEVATSDVALPTEGAEMIETLAADPIDETPVEKANKGNQVEID